MGAEQWIVKKPSGEELGIIKRLIINPATRQISYADVVLGDNGRLVRVPWENFEVHNKWITLNQSEGDVSAWMMGPRSELAETVTMDVWP